MKKILFFSIFVLLILSMIVFATQSSDEYLQCVSKEIYKKCDMGMSICESFEKGCPEDLKSFSRSDILNLLVNREKDIPDREPIDQNGKLVLECENKEDYYQFIRMGADSYNFKDSFGTNSIPCPTNNYYFYITIIGIGGIGLFGITILSIKLWNKYKKKGKSKTNRNAPKRRK